MLPNNDTIRRWIHVIEVTESIGDVLKRAGLSKAKMQLMMEKSSNPSFLEPGDAEKVDSNTLRVLLYKLIRATGAKEEHWAKQFDCEPTTLSSVLDTVREQVENLDE